MKYRITRVGLAALLIAAAATGVLATSGLGQRPDKSKGGTNPAATAFVLRVDGLNVGSFTKFGGITSAVEQAEYMQAGEKGPTYGRFVGKAKPPTLTLRRPVSANLTLQGWHDAVRGGNMAAAMRSATLTAYGETGTAVAKWQLENAMPVELEVTSTTSGGRDVLVEGVTLVADAIRAMPPG